MFKEYKIDNRWVNEKGYFFGDLRNRFNDIGNRWYKNVNGIEMVKELYEVSTTAIFRWKYEMDFSGYIDDNGDIRFEDHSYRAERALEKIVNKCIVFNEPDTTESGYTYMKTLPNLIEKVIEALDYICSHG